jgi:hypothetical protein
MLATTSPTVAPRRPRFAGGNLCRGGSSLPDRATRREGEWKGFHCPMTRYCTLLALVLATSALLPSSIAVAIHPYGCQGRYCCGVPSCGKPPCCLCCRAYDAYRASQTNWHGNYYDVAWGGPVPLVCPPNAGYQTKWAWGVGNTQVVPISHQFGRSYPGPGAGGGAAFLPTPIWPNSTDQFGVYYVRGPW